MGKPNGKSGKAGDAAALTLINNLRSNKKVKLDYFSR
jgi:hypothetical protein